MSETVQIGLESHDHIDIKVGSRLYPEATDYWDGRLASSRAGPPIYGMEARYSPEGVRIYKKRKWGVDSYDHKYIVDIVGDYPTVLLTLDAADNDAVLKTYIHANGQVLAQHDGDCDAQRYFYLHDRLGSVRTVIDANAQAKNCYFYDPWGLQEGTSENQEGVENFYRFAGYMIDLEAGQYYCNARQYDYYIGRFTSRDPVRGKFKYPLTLHVYLYCVNDPVNRVDPMGEWSLAEVLSGTKNRAVVMASRMGAYLGKARAFAKKVHLWAAAFNAALSGTVNALSGPESVSWDTKFAIGASAGFMEYQIGRKWGLGAGGVFAGAYTAAMNNAYSGNRLLSRRTAFEVGLGAGLGALGVLADVWVKDIRKMERIFFSYDRQTCTNLVVWACKWLKD